MASATGEPGDGGTGYSRMAHVAEELTASVIGSLPASTTARPPAHRASKPSERAITASWTSVVPSPISRIFESR
jgi:hypothetical protein